MKSYYGNYLGVVITGGDKDPEHRGRTQIFVPNIMPALYENWNEPGEDITFEVIGQGLDGSLNPQVVDRLRNTLPWAECAAPITGASPSYGTSVGGFVSEVIRNVGVAAEAVGEAAKSAWNALSGPPPTDQAGTLATLTNSAAADKYANGRCGPAVAESVLQKVYGYTDAEIRAGSTSERRDGGQFNNILPNLGWKAIKIDKPEDAPPGAIISYAGTSENQYGHVEAVGQNASGQKTYLFGLGEVSSPGGGTRVAARNMKGFQGVCWLPPDDRVAAAAAKKGLPNVSPSALPNPQPATGMQPDPTKEQEAATALDAQQKVDLGMQSSPEQMSLGGASSGLPPGVSKNDLIMAMRIAGAESGFGVPGSAIGRETGDLGLQAANAFGWGYYDKQYGFDHKKYFPGNKRTAAQGLAFIKDYPQMAFKIDTGLIQANQDDARSLGLKVDGDSTAQIYSLASHISKQRATDPRLNDLIEGGQFDAIHNYKNSKGVWGGIPGYNLKKEHELSGINSYPKTMAELAKYGGDPEAMLADWAKKVPSTPSIQEMMGADYKAPAYDTGVAANQPIVQNPTPHHGISGPNTNNQALGMFGYASEGQSVWVFFREGNPLFPVYFAASYGNKEWGNMYQNASNALGSGTPGTLKMQSMFYGGGFNSSLCTDESEVGQGHSFQLFDNNGSNLTFAKDHTQFNAMYNHVQRVMGDSHDITETNKEVRVKGNYNTFTEQDMFITIGNWTDDAIAASDEIQSYINEAMEIKAAAGKSGGSSGGGGSGEGNTTTEQTNNTQQTTSTQSTPAESTYKPTDYEKTEMSKALASKKNNLDMAAEWKDSSDPELKSVYDSAKRGYDSQLAINKSKNIT